MLQDAPNITHLWGQLIVEELVRLGVAHFCVSPGSRSTPLAWAVASHAKAQAHIHVDERGTAYYALGMAKALQSPVALVCTSGTAVANYFPAVVEARQSYVPLILLTADRPPELLDAGANQAIDQRKIFGDYVRWQHELPAPTMEIPPEAVLTAVDQAVYRARGAPAGPVHLNCLFREPLDPTPDGFNAGAYLTYQHGWVMNSRPYTEHVSVRTRAAGDAIDVVASEARDVARGVLVVGQLDRPQDAAAAEHLGRALGWPVFPDITSGLRLGDRAGIMVHNYDQLLLAPSFRDALRPQMVIHLGGAITSKRLLTFLRDRHGIGYTHVAPHADRHDPNHRVRRRIQMQVSEFCEAVAPHGSGAIDASWHEWIYARSIDAQQTIEAWMAKRSTLSEIVLARKISELLPENSALFLGNSMPVRDMDMYASPGGHRVRVATNRGASGIDGTIATAAGYANALGAPMTAIVGDLAALHDLNSLALLRQPRAPVVLIVINNDGGGIFSFLPIAAHPEHFERFFGTPHGLRFDKAAAMFGLAYASPDSPRAFADAYHSAIHGSRSVLLEVTTDREHNVRTHRALQETLVKALEV